MCVRAGYAPQAGVAFLTRLGAFASSTGGVAQLLSTHPPLQERIGQLQPVVGRA
jgi:predicted Zn-dependent protease